MRVLPPKVSATLALASARPVMATACSLALTTSSSATVAIVGAFGTSVSTVMVRVVATEVLPDLSVARAERISSPWPIAAMSAAVSVYVQLPLEFAVTLRIWVPIDSATLAFASAVPVIAAVCSLALTMSSPATFEMVGGSMASVSTVMLRVPAAETLPAASRAVADSVSSPWPIAAMSAAVNVYVQSPCALAVTVRVLPPSVSVTVAFASAVPATAAVCSVALTTSSPATTSIVGAFGTRVSTLMERVPADETLPAASVAAADSVSSPWPMAAMSAVASV